MLVSITLLAIALGWLAWQAHTAQFRQAMRREIETSGGVLFVEDFSWFSSPPSRVVLPGVRGAKIPLLRRTFGDSRVDFIAFDRELTEADRRAVAAFPEAEVTAIP